MTIRLSSRPGCPDLPDLAQPFVPTSGLVPWALPNLPNLFRARMCICNPIRSCIHVTHRLGRLGRLGQHSSIKSSRCPNLIREVGQVGTAPCFTGIAGGEAGRVADPANLNGEGRHGSSSASDPAGSRPRDCSLFTNPPKGVK